MSTNYQMIARLKRKEVSNRKIAETLGIARNTVNRTVSDIIASGLSMADVEIMSDEEISQHFHHTVPKEREQTYAMPDYEALSKELARPGVSMTLLWEEYYDRCRSSGKAGYQLTQFKKYFRDHLSKAQFTEVIHHKAGEMIEVDWDGTKAHWMDPDTGEIIYGCLFVAVLAFSGYAYAQVCPDMKMASWIDAHNQMYQYFGGVTQILTPDNLKTGVTSHGKDEVILNRTYADMAEHYGTIIIPTRVRRPKDKPLVENTVGKLTTQIIARMRDYQFFSIQEYNAQLRTELDLFNRKQFQKKDGSRYSIFMEYERPLLLPLPEHPYILCEWRKAKVQSNAHISLLKNYYSVPYQYIGKEVQVKLRQDSFDVLSDGQLLCTHQLIKDHIGAYDTVDAHMPPNSSHYGEWNSTRYLNWAKTKGPNTYQVIFKLFEGVKNEQRYYRAAHAILKLADAYSNDRLEDACQYALCIFTSPTYKNLKHIIATNQDTMANKDKPAEVTGRFVRGGSYFEK